MSQPTSLAFTVLGPVTVRVNGDRVDIGSPKQRAILALLLLRSNRVVPVDTLLDVAWGSARPATARKNLHVYISALRKLLGPRIRYESSGYVLSVRDGDLDLDRFHSLAASGRRALRSGDEASAARVLGEAVRLWRDHAFADLLDHGTLAEESVRLAEQFATVYEDWADAQITIGNHLEVLDTIDRVAAEFPYRERLVAAKMTALHECGRKRDAISQYEVTRQLLARELGIDPSPLLTELFQQILAGQSLVGQVPAPRASPSAEEPLPRPVSFGLPRDLPMFVGRTAELDMLLDLLHPRGAGGGVVLLSGRMGSGKTALAVHAATLVAADYPDGVFFVPLRDIEGQARPWRVVLSELLDAVGADEVSDAWAVDVWRSWLARHSLLMILDDVVDEETVRVLSATSGASHIIATSNRNLSGLDAVHRVHVGALSSAEAVDLLGRYAGPARVVADRATADRIAERCGRSALPLRIIGAKLARMRHMSLRDFDDQLEQSPDVLDEFVAGDLSLRRKLEEYLDDLPAELRETVVRLGMLPTSQASHAELAAALDRVGANPEHLIYQLLEENILAPPDAEVSAHAVVYAIPDLIHRFARQMVPVRRVDDRLR